MSILYLEIKNIETKETIGSYEYSELKNDPIKKEIEDKIKEIISKINIDNKYIKNHINFKNDSKNFIDVFYLSTNSRILYLTFIKLTSKTLQSFKVNFIYDLLEDIDSQNIIKFIGKGQKLTNVGQQNLSMCIDKYYNLHNFDDIEINKIDKTNKTNIYVKDDKKENGKNTMNNIPNMSDNEGKSLNIKDSNIQLEKDDNNLDNKMEKESYLNRFIYFIVTTSFLTLIIYILVK